MEWAPEAVVTPLGQLPFFIEYLRLSGLYEAWIEQCPLSWTSPNAPRKEDVLETLLLSVLSGHQRYAHINGLRGEGVNVSLLGMKKVVSDDAVRRALLKMDEAPSVEWLQNQLRRVYEPLLSEPWILDADVTVKPLYGHQEGAGVDNLHKPGRPSHTYHTYQMSPMRLVLEVEVQSGKETASKYSSQGLWDLLHRLPATHWPALIRGDCDWGIEGNVQRAEQEGVPYLFKLRSIPGVRRAVERLMRDHHEWAEAGQGWEGAETTIRLQGWGRERRVIVLRRHLKKELAVIDRRHPSGLQLGFTEFADKEMFTNTAS